MIEERYEYVLPFLPSVISIVRGIKKSWKMSQLALVIFVKLIPHLFPFLVHSLK